MNDFDWEVWVKNPLTETFMKYIFYKKIEYQQDLLDKKYNQESGPHCLGAYRALSELLSKFNELKARSK